MSNLKMETPDCDCGDNCCQPPKQKLWKKIIFFVVILAVLVIVTVKLTSNSHGIPVFTNDSTSVQQSGALDSVGSETCSKTCDQSETSSCCPPTRK